MRYSPTLKQFRYLVALNKVGHFSQAAESCGVTQSTLSAGLKEMEALLGVTLVERSRRHVLFTPIGEVVVRRAKAILADVDNLLDTVTESFSTISGRIRLGIIPTIAPWLLGRMMPAVRRQLTDVSFDLLEDKSAVLCQRLNEGELDLVLYALPYTCEGVEELPLFKDPFVGVWPSGHAPTTPTIRMEDLAAETVLLLEEGHCLKDHALSACQLVGHQRVEARGTSLATIVEMVAGGAGMTLLPSLAVQGGLAKRPELECREFIEPRPSRTVGLIWRSSSPRADTFRTLGAIIKDIVVAQA